MIFHGASRTGRHHHPGRGVGVQHGAAEAGHAEGLPLQAGGVLGPDHLGALEAELVQSLVNIGGTYDAPGQLVGDFLAQRAHDHRDAGTFSRYIWGFVDGKAVQNRRRGMKDLPARTDLSDAISRDLKRRGFSFVGSTIIYAHMQATGMVNDHVTGCFRHGEIRDMARPAPVQEEWLDWLLDALLMLATRTTAIMLFRCTMGLHLRSGAGTPLFSGPSYAQPVRPEVQLDPAAFGQALADLVEEDAHHLLHFLGPQVGIVGRNGLQ